MLYASLTYFFENIYRGFVYRPVLSAVLIAIICAVAGVYISLRKMVFLVDGIAHSAFAGGALGILLVVNPYFTIGAFGVGTALSMGYFSEKGKLSNDTAVGIIFSFAMALGVIFIGLIRSFSTGVSGLLFGSITTVSEGDLFMIIIIGLLVFGFLYFTRKEMNFITFDEHLARANGMPVRLLNYLFLILVALVIVIAIKIIGVILLLAMIVTPAATAFQFSYRLGKLVKFSIIFAIIGALGGYLLAYLIEISATASIICVYTAIFLFSLVISPKRKSIITETGDVYCKQCMDAISEDVECEFCQDSEIHIDGTHHHDNETPCPICNHNHGHNHQGGHSHDK